MRHLFSMTFLIWSFLCVCVCVLTSRFTWALSLIYPYPVVLQNRTWFRMQPSDMDYVLVWTVQDDPKLNDLAIPFRDYEPWLNNCLALDLSNG